MITLLIFLLVLGLLIFVHELGHFLTAKWSGCAVDEFGFGFPPRLFGIKRGETTYSINLIPFGGFVRIRGEEDGKTSSTDKKNLQNKSVAQRFGITVAGVVMNMILAAVLLSIGAGLGVPTVVDDGDTSVKEAKIQIIGVADSSPASGHDIQPGMAVLSIDGQEVEAIFQIQEIVSANLGSEIAVRFDRFGEEEEINLLARADHPEDEGPLGVELVRTGIVSYPWYQTVPKGIENTFLLTTQILRAFGEISRDFFTTGEVEAEVAGPVGIAVITGQIARLGIVYLLQFTALLSINLAIINILPLPALDGGRIIFIALEAIRRKKLNREIENRIHTTGFILLILLMIVVTFQDILRFQEPIKNFWHNLIS